MAGALAAARQNARAQTQRNARLLTGLSSDQDLYRRAGRWWDFPAKFEVADRIADEEKARQAGHRNDHGDARRHARWSRRTAEVAGPGFSRVAGFAHELEGAFNGQPVSEFVMDMWNNDEGITSFEQNRPIDPAKLQDRPLSLRAAIIDAESGYQGGSPKRGGYPAPRDRAARPMGPRRYPAY